MPHAEVTEEQLLAGNRWLIRLRWLASVGIVGATALAAGPLGYPVPREALTFLGGLVAAYNLLFVLVAARLAQRPPPVRRAAEALANAQLAADLVALALLLHLSGGVDNPFALYLLFHMIIAGILLPPLTAYCQAALATALYAVVVGGEHWGWLARVEIFADRGRHLNTQDVLGVVAVMASALFTAVFLTSVIAQQLRRREAELAAALSEARDQANACEIARSGLIQTQEMRLAYMRRVSHELRAPLSTVGMTLRVLLDQYGTQLPEHLRAMVGRAEARIETMLDLVGDLLTLSRMREAPLAEARRLVSVPALVAGVVDSLQDAASAHGVAVVVELPPELPDLYGQADALHTMLLNLVGNAIKYTPSGGQVTVGASYDASSSAIVLSVRDTGMGIAAADLPRLFEEFYRTEAARQSGIHGTGLGLAIVRLTAEAHGGEVHVASEPGQGSVFSVRLPIADRESMPSGEAPARQ